jgi:hypothetical protein
MAEAIGGAAISGMNPGAKIGGKAAQIFADERGQNVDQAAHHAGSVCVRCGHTLEADTPARRSLQGGWIHDVCPLS